MGGENVKAAYAIWRHLPDRAFRALTYMAAVSYDRPKDGKPARTYWGGREAIAFALGKDIPPPAPDSAADDVREKADLEYEAAIAVAKRAISTLHKQGAIETIELARQGKRAVYRLNLGAFQGDADRTPEGDAGHTPWGDDERTPKGDADRTPKEQERNQGGPTIEEQHSPQVTTSPGPVDNDDEIDLRVRPGIAALRASIRGVVTRPDG